MNRAITLVNQCLCEFGIEVDAIEVLHWLLQSAM
jgi:hypothetical protein